MEKLIHKMESAHDLVSTHQLKDLNEKLIEKKAHIAFCGHFSAGKSSLINRLCEHELLPSSPIPTSANVVSIYGGSTPEAIVYKNGQAQPVTVPLDRLKDYTIDGSDVRTVDIRYPVRLLNDYGLVFYDTPGIDSTDAAHHQATSAALHMADVVFYVTDYNHVQSETNFVFLQQLQSMGKAIILLINQIDKHREREIHFREYDNHVKQALQVWEIRPEAVMYLSLREPDHPYNQLHELVQMIEQIGEAAEAWNTYGIHQAATEVIRDHMERRYEQQQANIENLEAEMKREAAVAVVEKERADLQAQVQFILNNAPVIPALLRDKVHSFVESCDPSFRIGFFGAKKKTAEEVKRRVGEFLSGLKEQVLASIVVHLNQIAPDPLDWEEEWDEEWLKSKVNTGAILNYDYTMQYAKEIEQSIKSAYRKRMNPEIDKIVKQLEQNPSEIEAKRVTHMDELKPDLPSFKKLEELHEQERHVETELLEIVAEATGANPIRPQIIPPEMRKIKANELMEETTMAGEAPSNSVDESYDIPDLKAQAKPLVEQLDMGLNVLEQHPLFSDQHKRLIQQRNQLLEATFTIALFGAFSAGKSSFVNALIGQDVLPVSPNPMTAAVNRILPPDESHLHGTAIVNLKSQQRLAEEVEAIMDVLGLPFHSIEDALSRARKIEPQDWKGQARTRAAFLIAAAAGWDRMHKQLGEQLEVDLDDYRMFAANEEYSCFVEQIDLYYDSPLSRQGLILVDTPGADSINARHTGVAFQTIKEADAIFYVTYYNHAFSQADQEFLIQLGRMKSTVSLHHLFFIINAADLASDEQELEMVKRHVGTQLAAFDLHDVNLFTVSSHQGLEGRQNKQAELWNRSGLPEFEASFYDFVANHLLHTTYTEILQNMQDISDGWKKWIEQTQLDETEKERQKDTMKQRLDDLPKVLDLAANECQDSLLEQEIRERIFYVKQRTHYRFGELFRHTFHPSVLQDSNPTLKRDIVQAHKQLWDLLARYVTGELMTLMWGIEKSLSEWMVHYDAAFLDTVRKLYPDMNLRVIRGDVSEQIIPYTVKEHEERPESKERWLLKQFRNSRYFFEEDGKVHLSEQLEKEILSALDRYADTCAQSAIQHYSSEHDKLIRSLRENWEIEAEKDVLARIESMDEGAVGDFGFSRWQAFQSAIHESAKIGTH